MGDEDREEGYIYVVKGGEGEGKGRGEGGKMNGRVVSQALISQFPNLPSGRQM